MWTRKHLKHQAKKSLKSNYQKMVSVCFLIAFLTTSFASSTFIFRQFRPGLQHPQYIYQWKIFYLCHFKDCQRGLP